MGVLIKGINTRGIIAYSQPIYYVGVGTGSTSGTGTSVAGSWVFTTPRPGDLMIVIVSNNNAGGNNWTPPSGWTELVDQGVAPNLSVSWKNYVSGDPTSWLWTSSVTAQLIATMIIYRNAAIDVVGATGTVTNGNTTVSAPAITTLANNTVVLSIFATSAGTAFAAPASTSQINSYTVSNTTHATFWNFQQTAGSTGVKTATATGTGANVGLQLSIKSNI